MKKKILLSVTISVLFLLVADNVSAWGPHTHNFIADKVKENKNEINISVCFDDSVNEQAFRAGLLLPDIAILDYIRKNENYLKTHSWDFQKEIMNNAESQDEKCLAYGIAVHLISDSVSHGKFIPSKIKETGFPSWMVHPLMEEKYDECLILKNKNLITETGKSLDAFYNEKKEEYTEKIKNSLGEKTNLNVKRNINELKFIVNAMKITAIVNKPSLKALNLIKSSCNETEINNYMQETENLVIDYFRLK